jgi:LysR family transcriptional activator of dmlA
MKQGDTTRGQWPLIDDLHVFLTVIRKESFSKAALELGQSPAYISKRIHVLEKKLNTQLFFRNTRQICLTPAGEQARLSAIDVLYSVDKFVSDLSASQENIKGDVHICSSFGFGIQYIAPVISELAFLYPDLNVRLTLTDQVIDLEGQGVDLEIRIGDDIKDLYIARKLASNNRILCASPDYLKTQAIPKQIEDLRAHRCLVIQERNERLGQWNLTNGLEIVQIPVTGPLTSNSGAVILDWALKGHGIMCRSLWNVQSYLETGALVRILPEWYQRANVWAVYPSRPSGFARLKVCIDFLEKYFAEHPIIPEMNRC